MRISMVALAGPVPWKVGVLSLVRLSVLEAPVSESGTRSGVLGTVRVGATIWTESAADCALTVCPLVARAVKL